MNINELLKKQAKLRTDLAQHKYMLEKMDHLHTQFPTMEFKANLIASNGNGAVIQLDYEYFREHYLIVHRNLIIGELAKVDELIDAVNTLLGKQNEK